MTTVYVVVEEEFDVETVKEIFMDKNIAEHYVKNEEYLTLKIKEMKTADKKYEGIENGYYQVISMMIEKEFSNKEISQKEPIKEWNVGTYNTFAHHTQQPNYEPYLKIKRNTVNKEICTAAIYIKLLAPKDETKQQEFVHTWQQKMQKWITELAEIGVKYIDHIDEKIAMTELTKEIYDKIQREIINENNKQKKMER